MLILKELRFQGIGRFVDEQTVSFDKFSNHLIQVDGKNNNTGGSSGAAKTTIFNALDYLFGLNTIPNTKLQSRLTEETMSVEGDFDYNGRPITISRSKKLKITDNSVVTTGSSALTEEKLDQIISIPRHLLKLLLHKKQGEKGFFLSLSPRETNDFLTDAIGLGKYKKDIIDLDKRILDLSKMMGVASSKLNIAINSLKASDTALAALGSPPNKEVDQSTIINLKAKVEASSEQLKRLLATYRSDLAIKELNKPILLTEPYDSLYLDGVELELKAIDKTINSLSLAERDRQHKVSQEISRINAVCAELMVKIKQGESAKTEATAKALEVKKIREQICPTCEQSWLVDAAKAKEQQLIEQIKEHRRFMLDGEESAKQLDTNKALLATMQVDIRPILSKEVLDLQQKREQLFIEQTNEKIKRTAHSSRQHEHNKKKLDSFDAERKALLASHETPSRQAQGQADLDRKTFDMAVMKFRSYEEARIRHSNSCIELASQEKTYKNQVDGLTLELSTLKSKFEEYEEAKRAIKSYLSCKFEEALDIIGTSATKLVRHVPNMANGTIRLVGMRETKDGKIKEEVNAVLDLEGDENIDIRTLCGGERSAIDMAVDLSVIDLIESKTGNGLSVLVLDEPFTGMDSTCIEMALEVLKNSNPNKKILIVDHNPIVKEAISDRILVIRNGDISHIKNNI